MPQKCVKWDLMGWDMSCFFNSVSVQDYLCLTQPSKFLSPDFFFFSGIMCSECASWKDSTSYTHKQKVETGYKSSCLSDELTFKQPFLRKDGRGFDIDTLKTEMSLSCEHCCCYLHLFWLNFLCRDQQLRGVRIAGQDVSPLFTVRDGWSPVAPQAAFTSGLTLTFSPHCQQARVWSGFPCCSFCQS